MKCLKLGSNLFSVELLIVLAGWCLWPTEAGLIIPGYDEYEFGLCDGDFYNKTDLSDDDRTLTLNDCAELCTENPDCHIFSFSSIYEVCKLFTAQGCNYYDLFDHAAYSTYYAESCIGFPPALANGSPTVAYFAYKSPAAYQCDPNYAKTGNDNMTCLVTGFWEGELPRCTYQNYYNCEVHCEYANVTENVALMCPADYEILIIYANLGWDPASVCTPPDVTKVECLNPDVNGNLKHFCDGKMLCEFDVDLDGSDLFVSFDDCDTVNPLLQLEYKCVQNLDTDDEICEVDEGCSADYSIIDGAFTTIMDETGATFNYSCNLGFVFDAGDDDGDNSILVACTNGGSLEFPAPACAVVDCGNLDLVHATFSATGGTEFSATASVSCIDGYKINRETTLEITCQSTGFWSSTEDCSAVDCGEPTLVSATFNPPSGTTFDNSATIVCKAGYETATGDSELTVDCLASGLWSSSDDCTAVKCGDAPAAPTRGSRSVTTTTFQSTVTYSCESTHLLEGEAELTCQADGMWSGVAPHCTLLNQYVQIAVLQTDKDCLDYNENTLADLLESASDDIKAYMTQQLEMIPEMYRNKATIKIIGIRCASPLSFVVEIQLETTANEIDTIAQLNIILDDTEGEMLEINGGSIGSIQFVSVKSSDSSVALYDCNPGYYIDFIEKECRPCAKNTYQPNAIKELCLACPSGTFTEGLATTGNEEDVCIPEAESGSGSLVLGLAIGIPLGLLLIIGLIVAVIYVCRKYYLNSRMARRGMHPKRVYRRRAVQLPLAHHNMGLDGPYATSFGPVRY